MPTPIFSCRACKNLTVTPFLRLGTLPISDFPRASKRVPTAPLTLSFCDPQKGGCGLVQLHDQGVNKDTLYRQYWYKSGMNQTMIEALRDVADTSNQYINLKKNDIVVDIGANDGTLLSFFPRNLITIAFEPAKNLISELSGKATMVINDYFSSEAFEKLFPTKKAKLITSIAMFYDLEDPLAFMKEIQACLASDGVWINQMSTVGDMIEQSDFMTICHEHVTYFSLEVFRKLLDKADLQLMDVQHNAVNGGSIRTVVMHARKTSKATSLGIKNIARFQRWEKKLGLQTLETYQKFAQESQKKKEKLKKLLTRLHKQKKSIYIYGASTKGNTLLGFCELSFPLITAAIDRNPAKWGRKISNTNIPIFSEEYLRSHPPDYLLVLPWHFKEEFVKREKEYLKAGGKMIFPLPTVEIVGNNSS